MKLDPKDINELIEFSQKHPWQPHYPRSLVHRFLTELISSDHLIFDIHDKDGRASVAVMLDKVTNGGNNACLEIIGMRSDVYQSDVLSRFLEMAQDELSENKSGIQLAILDSLVDEDFLETLELEHYYDTFEMKADLNADSGKFHTGIAEAQEIDSETVYKVLSIAFKNSPDTSIPQLEVWNDNFLKSSNSHFYLWKESDKVVGFLNLIRSDNGECGEIRTIGVLPDFRGKQIGQHLLNHAMAQAFNLGSTSCELTVAVTNQKALALYERSGLKPMSTYKCYVYRA